MKHHSQHPAEESLALLASGDLPLWERWMAQFHVKRCNACAAVVARYAELRMAAGSMADDLNEEEWARLESEMRANIRLGLTAGALVERDADRPSPLVQPWRWAAVAASLVFVFGAGIWLDRGPGRMRAMETASTAPPVVEAGSQGLALRNTDAALELISPRGSAAVRTVNWDGSAGARYFDGETGQVTIHRVAWEDEDAR